MNRENPPSHREFSKETYARIEELRQGNPVSPDSGIFGGLQTQSYRDESEVLLLAVPWAATCSYGLGTDKSPAAIRFASHQLDLFDSFYGETFALGIYLEQEELYSQILSWQIEASQFLAEHCRGSRDHNDYSMKVNSLSEKLNQSVAETASRALDNKQQVGIIGGDHSSPFGLIAELDRRYEEFSILHIDAHMDLRRAYEDFVYSHASIMYNVLEQCQCVDKVVGVGMRDFSAGEYQTSQKWSEEGRYSLYDQATLFKRQASGETLANLASEIVGQLSQNVYVSFDVDGLDPSYCPNTGTPVPGGLTYDTAIYLIEELSRQEKSVIGFDLCEVGYHESSEYDANVGARLAYKLCGAMGQS